MPTIPDHLLIFEEARWMPLVEDGICIPILRAREKWRQAQDAWGHTNRIWRAEFEELQRQQLAERQEQQ
ncbi:hypothetical protein [Streptosporangium sp. NPDC051022]|uniref:hypothetical protein n=1 Tax=Streptosporangium sp. NPDC051022 TaxID=3155752 RepID=UPI003441456B